MNDNMLLSADIVRVLREAAVKMQENHVKEIRDLDAEIGDGDLGITVQKGFKAVEELLSSTDEHDISRILKDVGMVFSEANPSTFSAFFATAFRKASAVVKGKESVDISDLSMMFKSAVQGITKLGKAKPGDKTILDALIPASEEFEKRADKGGSIKNAFKAASEAAEKAAAEKAAAEKAAAEKAAAEKAAAEKAAAEKAAAEKAAAEKKKAYLKTLPLKKFEAWKPAKVFRAAVDEEYLKNFASPPIVSGLSDKEAKRIKKLLLKKRDMATIRAEIKEEAVEREAAEKAAAEKAAAEREAAEKAAAEREAAEKATMKKVIIGLASGFIILVALIFSASSSNNSKYYIKEKAGILEIWQGRYAPLGEERMMTLPGVPLPEQINAVYSESEVFPLIFNYYIDKADAISAMSDTPDYVAIKSFLNEALLFATTGDLSKKAYSRLNDIKFNDLMYKAGVAESRGAVSDLDEAMRYLNKASLLKVGAGKSDVVKQKIESIKEQKAEMIEAQVAEEATGTASVKSDVVKQKIESTKEQSAEMIEAQVAEEATGTASVKSDVVKQKIESTKEQSTEMIEAQVAEEATVSAPAE